MDRGRRSPPKKNPRMTLPLAQEPLSVLTASVRRKITAPLPSTSDSRPKAVVSIWYMFGAAPPTPPSNSTPSVSMSAWVNPPAGTTSSRKMAPFGPTYLAVAMTVVKEEQLVVAQTLKVSFTPRIGGAPFTFGVAGPSRAPGAPASSRSRSRSAKWNRSASVVRLELPEGDARGSMGSGADDGCRCGALEGVVDGHTGRGLLARGRQRHDQVFRPGPARRRKPEAPLGKRRVKHPEFSGRDDRRRWPGAAGQHCGARARPSIPARTGDEAGEKAQRKGAAGENEWHEGNPGAANEVGRSACKIKRRNGF